MLEKILLVALGGALGAVTRFLVGTAFNRFPGWPWGTLFINLTGCFLISLFFHRAESLDPAWRYLFPVGFVGAYTTFSTFELETVQLAEQGRLGAAGLYVLTSNVLGFLAVLLARRF